MLVDFHMHSTASDGVMRPLDLRAANKAAGIKMMSLTDHDTIDGFMTMLKEPDLDIAVIPGCEFSSTSCAQLLQSRSCIWNRSCQSAGY